MRRFCLKTFRRHERNNLRTQKNGHIYKTLRRTISRRRLVINISATGFVRGGGEDTTVCSILNVIVAKHWYCKLTYYSFKLQAI